MPRQLKLPGMPEPQPRGTSAPTEPERLQDIAARAPMRTLHKMHGVEGILQSGQFKTQHETGRSGGTYDPFFRKDWEEEVFGPGDHPVYGYFSHGDTRDMMPSRQSRQDDPREDWVTDYGHTAFEFGEHMRKHTTYSWGDSLGNKPHEVFKQSELHPEPLRAGFPGEEPFTHAESFFTEMQVHARPTLADVTQAIIYETHDPNNYPHVAKKQAERTATTQAVLMGGNVPHEVRKVGYGGQMVLPLELEDWGSANWKKVGEGEPGKDIERQGWSGSRYAFETPRDEQRPMVSVRDKWRPNRARP